MKTLPKSLHTVTVLANVALFIQTNRNTDTETAMLCAMDLLGYGDATTLDNYGLVEKAMKSLKGSKA